MFQHGKLYKCDIEVDIMFKQTSYGESTSFRNEIKVGTEKTFIYLKHFFSTRALLFNFLSNCTDFTTLLSYRIFDMESL